ncbi:hypothetical protein ND00_04510 [Clostridium sp. L74]|nr:hypothetical protein ND00_04510 [Clostridium sp. L74]
MFSLLKKYYKREHLFYYKDNFSILEKNYKSIIIIEVKTLLDKNRQK